jgi:phosphomannomutase
MVPQLLIFINIERSSCFPYHAYAIIVAMHILANKQLVVFDLDGTLAESKSTMDTEMSSILNNLLETHHVAIISGGSYHQLTKQFLSGLSASPETLHKIHLFPTCGAQCYQYENEDWQERYADPLTAEEKNKILTSFEVVFKDVGYQHPEQVYGNIIEDRGTQITFSAVGQQAPVEQKNIWNKQYHETRLVMVRKLQELLPKFDVRAGGLTSIDITHEGINKCYGIYKIEEILGIPVADMLFVGDALFPGGNDEPVKLTGVDTVSVENPEETKQFLSQFLNKQSD